MHSIARQKLAVASVKDDLKRLSCCIWLQSVTKSSDIVVVSERTVHDGARGGPTQQIVSRPACQLRQSVAAVDDGLVRQTHVRQQKTLIWNDILHVIKLSHCTLRRLMYYAILLLGLVHAANFVGKSSVRLCDSKLYYLIMTGKTAVRGTVVCLWTFEVNSDYLRWRPTKMCTAYADTSQARANIYAGVGGANEAPRTWCRRSRGWCLGMGFPPAD